MQCTVCRLIVIIFLDFYCISVVFIVLLWHLVPPSGLLNPPTLWPKLRSLHRSSRHHHHRHQHHHHHHCHHHHLHCLHYHLQGLLAPRDLPRLYLLHSRYHHLYHYHKRFKNKSGLFYLRLINRVGREVNNNMMMIFSIPNLRLLITSLIYMKWKPIA